MFSGQDPLILPRKLQAACKELQRRLCVKFGANWISRSEQWPKVCKTSTMQSLINSCSDIKRRCIQIEENKRIRGTNLHWKNSAGCFIPPAVISRCWPVILWLYWAASQSSSDLHVWISVLLFLHSSLGKKSKHKHTIFWAMLAALL